MKEPQIVWKQLTAAARRAPRAPLPDAPFGFSARVAALGLAAPQEDDADLWLVFGRRAILGATLVMAGLLAFHYQDLTGIWQAWDGAEPIFDIMNTL